MKELHCFYFDEDVNEKSFNNSVFDHDPKSFKFTQKHLIVEILPMIDDILSIKKLKEFIIHNYVDKNSESIDYENVFHVHLKCVWLKGSILTFYLKMVENINLYNICCSQITQEIVNKYHKSKYYNFLYLPHKFKTQELFDEYISVTKFEDIDMHQIPRQFITRQMVYSQIVHRGYMFVPDHLLNEPFFQFYIKNNNIKLSLMPEKDLTDEMIDYYLKKPDSSLKEVPEKRLDQERVNKFCETHNFSLKKVPKQFINDRVMELYNSK